MNNQEIVSKLWNLCNVLRDDGITYHQYVTELTYIFFLKMAKETGAYRFYTIAAADNCHVLMFQPVSIAENIPAFLRHTKNHIAH